jgi:parallel beta-helix repeat protein
VGATMTSTVEQARQVGLCDESEVYHQLPVALASRRQPNHLVLILAAMLLSPACNPDMETGPTALPDGTEETWETTASSTLIPILPGQSIQAKVNSYPAGTQFLIKAGTHYRQRVVPKTGNWFIGEAGAILDGKDATPYAFEPDTIGPFPNYVRIKGLIIQHYASPIQHGAIVAGGGKFGSTIGWVVENCEIRYNAHVGIKLGDKMKVLNNFIHHNHQIGISGSGDSVLVQGNEIAYNNYLKEFAFGFELGGAKFIKTRHLLVRGNRVHHNQGNGLWTDMNNIYTVYENNTVDDNSGAGIFHEVSFDAKVRNNTTRRNGFARGWVTGAGILISASANVEVYGNEVLDNKQGIVGIQQERIVKGVSFSKNLKNLNVHNNTVRLSGTGVTGIVEDTGDLGVFTSRNNRFQGNSYDLGSYTTPFRWMRKSLNKVEWKAYGQDTNGTFF